jgi:general secretion pathway protein J
MKPRTCAPGRAPGASPSIELLVALTMMALLALMSWRGLDGMVRTRVQTEARADEVLALQVGLSQWAADLDAIVQTPQLNALDWNGSVLRLTRRSSAAATDGVLVVAWTRRVVDGRGQWLRWQSPALTGRGSLSRRLAAGLHLGAERRRRANDGFEVAVVPLDEWQIFYFRADAWTNPLSSDAAGGATVNPGNNSNIPDGVRLILQLPAGQALAGKLTRDWVRPTVSGGKS